MDTQTQKSSRGATSRVQTPGVGENACEAIFLENYDRLVRFLSLRLGDLDLARDIAQETIIKALEAKGRYDSSQKPWPWLKTIAINTAIDHLRRNGKEVLTDDPRVPVRDGGFASTDEAIVLEGALKGLTPRQRIALSLKYLSDWSTTDAAEFLGLSRSAFDQLLKRAKTKLSLEYRKLEKTLQGIAALTTARLRLRTRFHRINRVVDPAGTVGMMSVEHLSHALVALILVVGGSGTASPPFKTPGQGSYADQQEAWASAGAAKHRGQDGSSGSGSSDSKNTSDLRTHRSAADQGTAATFVQEATDPNKNVRNPEDTSITSLAMGGKRGRLTYAAGTTHCRTWACPPVLFGSSDGGVTWTRLPASGFMGTQIAVPPGDGNKVFAMGPNGLQISDDGGNSFGPAVVTGLPMATGSMAVSPLFNDGDPTVLIGAQTLMRYTDSDRLINPYPGSLTGPFEPAFSPTFESDSLFFLGGLRHGTLDGLTSTVYICNANGCNYRKLPARDQVPKIRLSGRSTQEGPLGVYAFTQDEMFIAEGDLTQFRALSTPWTEGTIADLEVSPDGNLTIVSIVGGTQAGLYLSADGGTEWRRVPSRVTRNGARDIVLSGERIIVALADTGVACSEDHGMTFVRRCS